jgi:hypothetical protein
MSWLSLDFQVLSQAAANLLSCDVRATICCSSLAKVTVLQYLVAEQVHYTSMTSRMRTVRRHHRNPQISMAIISVTAQHRI